MALTVRPTGFASQVDKGPKGYAVFSGEWDVGKIVCKKKHPEGRGIGFYTAFPWRRTA
jgi:hypothetical protein